MSAVIAELIANAYDADAINVTVRAPMGQFLATRAGGVVADKGFDIQVIDDGIGMTPQQVQDFFLVVGAERRNDPNRGSLSPGFKRKVMGRKGVGKLAPFGICKTIEVISAGGDLVNGNDGAPNAQGYLTSHIVLDYDRRDIRWSDELAASFQEWGQAIVKRIGTLSRDPLRKATLELFLEAGNVEERILHAYPADDQGGIRDNARDMARSFGRTISRGEAEDPEVVVELVDLSITLAPHITLNSMMKEAAADADRPLSVLGSFLRTARMAELSSFGRIAEDRLKVVERLEVLKDSEDTDENDLQQLISDAPWLINPEWAPVTENRTFSSLRREFEKYYEEKTGVPISLSDFQKTGKRPDFVLSSQEGTVQIIEIKKPHHTLTNPEMDRIVTYYQNMDAFLSDSAHSDFSKHFPDFHVTVVCDALGLTDAQRAAFDGYRATGKLTRLNWAAFLLRTEQVHQDFLREAERQRSAAPQPLADD